MCSDFKKEVIKRRDCSISNKPLFLPADCTQTFWRGGRVCYVWDLLRMHVLTICIWQEPPNGPPNAAREPDSV